MTPYFSLILPCYNVEKYVARCVQSILTQDFADYEIILVDDGSTDGTPALCDALAAEHGCIRVIHKENGGAASARNAGLGTARGKYVWFVDPDDWISPDALRMLHQASVADAPDVLKFNYNRIEEALREIRCEVKSGIYVGSNLEQLCQMAYRWPGKYGMSGCMHVYFREMLQTNHLVFVSEREIGSEDVLFTLQVLFHARSLVMLDQPLYNYERRSGSLSQTYNPNMCKQFVAFRTYIVDYLQRNQAPQEYMPLVERFFLWRLVVGGAMLQEYNAIPLVYTVREARKNVASMMALKLVRQAARKADRKEMPWQKKIQQVALRIGIEPLFYWLYYAKPRRIAEQRRNG